MLIEINNLQKQFTNDQVVTKVLHGLSFSIDEGEFVAIMGPSGSGKSTLMHILGFLDHLTSGTYKFKGKNVEEFDDDELANLRNNEVGFIFQSFNLLARTNVLENVLLPLQYSAKQKDKDKVAMAKNALKAVGLDHRLNHLSNQLSGGEKQRVAIARALVNDPSVIFADEPTGNLDSKSGQAVMNILQKLNDQGKTVILVTHEKYTSEHAKRIIRMKDGLIAGDVSVENRVIADGQSGLRK